MANHAKLRDEADRAAQYRGHIILWDIPQFFARDRVTQSGHCSKCSATLGIDTRPPANGIDIGGDAVAVNCKL